MPCYVITMPDQTVDVAIVGAGSAGAAAAALLAERGLKVVVLERRAREASRVYEAFKRAYSLRDLEQARLWQRLDAAP